jgi:hypothetical protein
MSEGELRQESQPQVMSGKTAEISRTLEWPHGDSPEQTTVYFPPNTGRPKKADLEAQGSAPQRKIKTVTATRTRETGRRYLVVYEDDEDDTGRWVAGWSVSDQQLLLEFDAAHQRRPVAATTPESAPPPSAGPSRGTSRDLKEIRGIFPMGDTWRFIVRFAESLRDAFLQIH